MKMPEDERDDFIPEDSEEDIPWDSDRELPWWIDGPSDSEIGGYRDVD